MSAEPMDLSAPTPQNRKPGGDVTAAGESAPPIRYSKPGDLHILGQPHETVLYHGDDVVTKLPDPKDDDDEVYEVEVTFDDVKSMFKDLQAKRSNLEDAPLRGRKVRDLERETAVLKSLHNHPNTAIRIRFPDRTVIQGIFRTSCTINDINMWLREYLHDPALDFYIFTAPPKKILKAESKLVEEGLVAKVVIYFGSPNMPDNNRVLKPDLYNKLSDPEKAFELAKDKLKVRTTQGDENEEDPKPSTETQLKDHQQSSSGTTPATRRPPVDKGKVPKWFKMK